MVIGVHKATRKSIYSEREESP